MIQDMLGDPEWADTLTEEDKRALTPLFWMHIQPYGEIRLNMGNRLQLASAAHTTPNETTTSYLSPETTFVNGTPRWHNG